jgi:hypothetical protein
MTLNALLLQIKERPPALNIDVKADREHFLAETPLSTPLENRRGFSISRSVMEITF